ncbi:hypothetical protein AS589_09325 [Empedobacter brevis]|uniref:hypothetical protein n=1 Tax=Empedobacter brevis TaxID=247 RepID=UPI0013202407|nr:hypothetical protein [Empedobacter brevis]QHC84956.1 hypothetical protein AS589_09325 [Empedobacter brevis]
MKLTSSKDFGKTLKDKTYSEYRRLRDNFDNFLEQPLTLGKFVPCDEDGNVLEEPKGIKCCGGITNDCDCRGQLQYDSEEVYKYQQAKERVLFEFDGNLSLIRNKTNFYIIEDKNGVYLRVLKNKTKTTIESLLKFSVEITLTKTAIKQIGL